MLESEREQNVKNQGLVSGAANWWCNGFLNGSVVRATLPMLLTKLEIGLREAEPTVTYLGEF